MNWEEQRHLQHVPFQLFYNINYVHNLKQNVFKTQDPSIHSHFSNTGSENLGTFLYIVL